MRFKKNLAFSLLELMSSVAIVGLLAAVAAPRYQKYVIESKMSEAYVMVKSAFDAAMILASDPVIVVKGVTNLTLQCRRTHPHGIIITKNAAGEYAPPSGKKEKVTYMMASQPPYNYRQTPFGYTTGQCVSYLHPEPSYYGLSVRPTQTGHFETTDDHYFSLRLAPDNYLAFALSSVGGKINGYTSNYTTDQSSGGSNNQSVYNVSSIIAVADLDGDYTGNNAASFPWIPAFRSDQVSYVFRGIFINQSGETEGTPGVHTENFGE